MVIGHEHILHRLRKGIETGRVAHAYLFYGPEGVGKLLAAREIAGEMIGATGFNETREEKHTPLDLLVLRPQAGEEKGVLKEKDISVEEVREVLHQLALLPYAGKRRVLIIDDAHKLTEAAQNALLKTLEEPPAHAVVIVVTKELGGILPTIVSRSQRVAFSLVPREQMEGLLDRLSGELLEQASFLVMLGRPGVVMHWADEEFQFSREMLQALFALSQTSLAERLLVAEKLAAQPAQSLRILEWWVSGLHEQVLVVHSDATVLLRQIEKVEKVLESIRQSSASNRLLLENLLIGWED
jgi:DNA polymerase III delta prime subunit